MPPKHAPKAPSVPARNHAKKAPRPASTKKKQAPPKPAAKKAESQTAQPNVQKLRRGKVTKQLTTLLQDTSASARSVVDFIVGPTCGVESRHDWDPPYTVILYRPDFFFNTTPFLLSVEANRLDVAQLLVAEHSADTKAVANKYANFTAVHMASSKGHLEMVRYLVEQCGLDVNVVDNIGRSPLDLAISCKHSDVALLLLELGADPNRSGYNEETPLHLASTYGLVDVARALIDKGVNIDAVDGNGQASLLLALVNSGKKNDSKSHSEVAVLLLELGADPGRPDANNWTPLHWACYHGLVDVVRVLIAKGVSRDALNSGGLTPLALAFLNRDLLKALLEARQ